MNKLLFFTLLSPLVFVGCAQIGYFGANEKWQSYAGFSWGIIGVISFWAFYFI